MFICSVIGVATFTAVQETFFVILKKMGILFQRPVSVIVMDNDPLFYILGAIGDF